MQGYTAQSGTELQYLHTESQFGTCSGFSFKTSESELFAGEVRLMAKRDQATCALPHERGRGPCWHHRSRSRRIRSVIGKTPRAMRAILPRSRRASHVVFAVGAESRIGTPLFYYECLNPAGVRKTCSTRSTELSFRWSRFRELRWGITSVLRPDI